MDSMRSLQTKNGMVINLDERHYYVSRSLEEKNEGPYCFRALRRQLRRFQTETKKHHQFCIWSRMCTGQMEHQIELVWLFRRNG